MTAEYGTFEEAVREFEKEAERSVLVRVGGSYYVASSMFFWDEPKGVVRFWEVSGWKTHPYHVGVTGPQPGEKVTSRIGDGMYIGADTRMTYYLKEGGRTKASAMVEFNAKKPKTKLPLRWRNGRWERLKRGEWV